MLYAEDHANSSTTWRQYLQTHQVIRWRMIVSVVSRCCNTHTHPFCGPPSLMTPSRASCRLRCRLNLAFILRNSICTQTHDKHTSLECDGSHTRAAAHLRLLLRQELMNGLVHFGHLFTHVTQTRRRHGRLHLVLRRKTRISWWWTARTSSAGDSYC